MSINRKYIKHILIMVNSTRDQVPSNKVNLTMLTRLSSRQPTMPTLDKHSNQSREEDKQQTNNIIMELTQAVAVTQCC